jgi:hypothetical protein
VIDAPGTKWVSRAPPAADWEAIKEFATFSREYKFRDMKWVEDNKQMFFADTVEVRGRLYRSRFSELRRGTSTCNSIAFCNWGNSDDIKQATTCCIKGFYKIVMEDDRVLYFVSIRTLSPVDHK